MNSFVSELHRPRVEFAYKLCDHTFAGLELRSLAFHFVGLLVYYFSPLFVGFSRISNSTPEYVSQ